MCVCVCVCLYNVCVYYIIYVRKNQFVYSLLIVSYGRCQLNYRSIGYIWCCVIVTFGTSKGSSYHTGVVKPYNIHARYNLYMVHVWRACIYVCACVVYICCTHIFFLLCRSNDDTSCHALSVLSDQAPAAVQSGQGDFVADP